MWSPEKYSKKKLQFFTFPKYVTESESLLFKSNYTWSSREIEQIDLEGNLVFWSVDLMNDICRDTIHRTLGYTSNKKVKEKIHL